MRLEGKKVAVFGVEYQEVTVKISVMLQESCTNSLRPMDVRCMALHPLMDMSTTSPRQSTMENSLDSCVTRITNTMNPRIVLRNGSNSSRLKDSFEKQNTEIFMTS